MMNPTAWRYAGAQAALNLTGGLWLPFLPLWFAHQGLKPAEFAVILTAGMLARVVTSPLAGILADTLRDRRLVAFGAACAALGLFLVVAAAGAAGAGFWTLLALMPLAAAFHASLGPLTEAMTVRAAEERGFAYARVRGLGSASFVATNLVGGAALSLTGPGAFMWTIAATVAIQAAVFRALPPLAGEREGAAPPFGSALRRILRDLGVLLSRSAFVVFLLAASSAQASHAVLYGFGTLNFARQGFSEPFIGALWSWGVAVEVGLFFVAHRFQNRIGATGLMALGAGLGALRWIGMAHDWGPWGALALQTLHAGSFALVHLGTMAFLARAVPASLAASAQSAFAVCAYGVGMGLATLLGGALYERVGAEAFYAMAGLSILALGLMLTLDRLWNGRTLFATEETRP